MARIIEDEFYVIRAGAWLMQVFGKAPGRQLP
jgi:hypothetical protein